MKEIGKLLCTRKLLLSEGRARGHGRSNIWSDANQLHARNFYMLVRTYKQLTAHYAIKGEYIVEGILLYAQ